MAKPKGIPALTAKRAWEAIKSGSLQVEPVATTRMWRVIGPSRIRYTWNKNGRKSKRFSLPVGSYLNPRWIPISNPKEVQELSLLPREDLAQRGIIQTPEGVWYRLIYQQVEGVFHVQRQIQKHILPGYDVEEEELWYLLDQIVTQSAEELRDLLDQRFREIDAIRPQMASRAEAIEGRLRNIKRRLNHVQTAVEAFLRHPLLKGETQGWHKKRIDGAILGVTRTLAEHHRALAEIRKEKPFSRKIDLAQYHLREAIAWLRIGDSFHAAEHLRKALPYLNWPEEEEKGG